MVEPAIRHAVRGAYPAVAQLPRRAVQRAALGHADRDRPGDEEDRVDAADVHYARPRAVRAQRQSDASDGESGRAACRETVCPNGELAVVRDSVKTTNSTK